MHAPIDLPAVVRATAADESQIMELCRGLHAENGIAAMDDDMVRAMLNRAFHQQGGTIGIIRGPKRIEAAIYLLLTSFWYTKDTHLEELFSYVHPDHRAGQHAPALIKFAQKCSDDISTLAGFKVPLIIGILTNIKMAQKVRLYRRLLGYPAGAMFVYNGTWKINPAGKEFWSSALKLHGRIKEDEQ